MKIAVLGWGSLVWDPGGLQIEGDWRTDGPLLPIEFARRSKRDRITMVIERSAPPVQVLWNVVHYRTLDEAREALSSREGTIFSRIGVWSPDDPVEQNRDEVVDTIDLWARPRKLDGVVWTALGPKWDDSDLVPGIDQMLDFLRPQGPDSEAALYIRNAPAQIQTRHRARIEQELERMEQDDEWTPGL